MFKRYLHKEIETYKYIMNDRDVMSYHYKAINNGKIGNPYLSLYLERLYYLEAISEYVIGKKYLQLTPLWPDNVSKEAEFEIEF
jgi:hypothetical protein